MPRWAPLTYLLIAVAIALVFFAVDKFFRWIFVRLPELEVGLAFFFFFLCFFQIYLEIVFQNRTGNYWPCFHDSALWITPGTVPETAGGHTS